MMNWLLKRWTVIGLWAFLLVFIAAMGIWSMTIGQIGAGGIMLGLAAFLLFMGPGRWAVMFADVKGSWWLYEDL